LGKIKLYLLHRAKKTAYKLIHVTNVLLLISPPHDISYISGKGKSKAIPLEAWTGPEDSRRLRLPNFKTIGT